MVDLAVILIISGGAFVLCIICALGAYFFGKFYGFSRLLFGEDDKKSAGGGERAPRPDAKPGEAKAPAPKPTADSSSDSEETDSSLNDDLLPNSGKALAKYRDKISEYQRGKGRDSDKRQPLLDPPSNIPSKAAKLLGAGKGGGREQPRGGGRDESRGGGRDEPRGGGRDEPRGGGRDAPRGGGRDEPRGRDGPSNRDKNDSRAPSRKYESDTDESYDEENPRRGPPPRDTRRRDDDDRGGSSRGGGRDDRGGRDDNNRGRNDRSPPRSRGKAYSPPKRNKELGKTIDNGSLDSSVGSVGSVDGTLTASSFFAGSSRR